MVLDREPRGAVKRNTERQREERDMLKTTACMQVGWVLENE